MQLKRITICIALAFAPGAFAAEAAETALPDVEVVGNKIRPLPAKSNSALGGIDIARQRAATSDTAKLLEGQPGVSLYGAGGVSSLPAIHGLADDRIRTKVDGMDLISACGNHMNPPLSYIDPSNVGSVRVFAGIAPVSVGGDSIGGTIMVESAAPEFAAHDETLLKGQAGAFYRSNGDAHGGNLSATIATERLSVTYSGSTTEADDYKAGGDFKAAGPAAAGRNWLAGDEVGSSMYKSTNQSLAFALRNQNHMVELKLGVQDIPYQGWPNQRMDMTGNDSEQFNLRYTGQYGWGGLEARAYHENTRHKMQFFDDKLYWYGKGAPTDTKFDGVPCADYLAVGTSCAAGMPMDTEGRNTGAVVKADILLSARDLLRVGGETQRYRLNDWWDPSGKGMWPNVFWNINNGERDRLALFGEWEAAWSARWQTQFGLRYEKVDMNAGAVQGYGAGYAADAKAFNDADRNKSDDNTDLTALARYTPSPTQAYEFGFARKTRSPNLYERYTWSKGGMAMNMINMAGDGNGYVGNLDLQPEVGHTLSATADWHDAAAEGWNVKVTPYYTRVEDYIDAMRCFTGAGVCNAANLTRTDGFVFLQFVNQRARLYGLDISGRMPLAETGGYGSFTATGVVSHVDGKNETTGDNLYNIMPLNAKFAVVQRLAGWTNTAEVELVDAKKDVSSTRNELRTAGYGLLNLRSSYEWKQFRFDMGIENVLDKFYNDPLGGAYTGQGKTMPPVAGLIPWGIPVPGMGRSVYVGATLKF
ncbi:MAG: TonB-dependent receptor [Gallionellales bacterium RIFCSPLOWO2_12_FULL_59_22]|nr:MAG: TonB-dependent receptor [Gallionellales bacterium RIFCSPLOWO2_02_FULL_59_110]OGT03741.1 MAG: TonB-dependent receptor [Gallionellales bacterium RIFCSPLOWO2_02_58_13]OGT14241.1 MAG: TonB-dependent receptor [Gallionellales bacterium RIFCSPLOWO2_12_FULL_59_22]